MKNNKNFIGTLRSIFISGLLTILPLALTIALFTFTFRIIESWVYPLTALLPKQIYSVPVDGVISEILLFSLMFIVIMLIGSILQFLLLKKIVDGVESLFGKIPLVRQVYFGIKQLLQAFNPENDVAFQRVALIEFPRAGVYSLGFIMGELASELTPNPQKTYLNVFIPNTPNPTSGYYVIVPQEECLVTTLKRQEAMTIIISGGIITPERFRDN